jgi:hypothetical protein
MLSTILCKFGLHKWEIDTNLQYLVDSKVLKLAEHCSRKNCTYSRFK